MSTATAVNAASVAESETPASKVPVISARAFVYLVNDSPNNGLDWNQSTNTVTVRGRNASGDETVVSMTFGDDDPFRVSNLITRGSNIAMLNGQPIDIATFDGTMPAESLHPVAIGGNVYLPLRFMANAFGFNIQVSGDMMTVRGHDGVEHRLYEGMQPLFGIDAPFRWIEITEQQNAVATEAGAERHTISIQLYLTDPARWVPRPIFIELALYQNGIRLDQQYSRTATTRTATYIRNWDGSNYTTIDFFWTGVTADKDTLSVRLLNSNLLHTEKTQVSVAEFFPCPFGRDNTWFGYRWEISIEPVSQNSTVVHGESGAWYSVSVTPYIHPDAWYVPPGASAPRLRFSQNQWNERRARGDSIRYAVYQNGVRLDLDFITPHSPFFDWHGTLAEFDTVYVHLLYSAGYYVRYTRVPFREFTHQPFISPGRFRFDWHFYEDHPGGNAVVVNANTTDVISPAPTPLAATVPTPTPQAPAVNIGVQINGVPVQFTAAQPTIVNGRTLVPLRDISESLGASVGWNDVSREISLSREGASIVMIVDSSNATINGNATSLYLPPAIIGASTFVPLRDISTLFGYEVSWDSANQVAHIASGGAVITPSIPVLPPPSPTPIPTPTAVVDPNQPDAEFIAFVTALSNQVIANATTDTERLTAIYNFVQLQFNHTRPQRTSNIRNAIDGSLRPSIYDVPFTDGVSNIIDGGAFGAPGIPTIVFAPGGRSLPRNEDYNFVAWEMLAGLFAAPENHASLFAVMARSVGFETMNFTGYFMPSGGSRSAHIWPKVRLNGNWYIFDVQRESSTNDTGQARHRYFMQPVADVAVQDSYHLCPACLEMLANI